MNQIKSFICLITTNLRTRNYSLLGLFLFVTHTCFSQPEPAHHVLHDKIKHSDPQDKRKSSRRKHTEKLFSFYFDNEDLIDIINFLAAEKEINVVLPMDANAITVKVTLHLEEKITLDEAWDILYTLLDIAGYSMIAKEQTYNIVKTTRDVSREALPLYIVKPDELPDSDKRIRYLYYFSNIKIPENPNEGTSEIFALVKEILPGETTIPGMAPSVYRLDAQTNSLLITDKANNIKALMKIITALDQAESQEKPAIIQLRYVPADIIANLFTENILKSAGDINQIRLGIRTPNNSTYFKKVRIVPDMRTNRLIVFGRAQAVERVRDFIHKYVDVELESGKSILHTYQLQYLDAKSFEVVLRRIVDSARVGGTEQSRAGAPTVGGAERSFGEVLIRADQPETISGEQPGGAYRGSNTLIIAARNDDYEHIKKIIEVLDIPQPQVIIEVLIADLTLQDIASLGSSIRNPLGLGLPNNVNFQSAQATDFLTNSVDNPTTIQADLLRRAFNTGGTLTSACDLPIPGDPCFSAARFATLGTAQGTAILSVSDPATGQTWGIGEIRKFLDSRKVLSHPHLITTNNQKAEIRIEEQRFARDQGSGSSGGTTTQTRKWIPAELSVTITPRISSADVVNLNVIVNINQFTTPASAFSNIGIDSASTANQVARNVTTQANVRSGNILALGGLMRVDTTVEQLETPLLGKIPIIGWLFKDRTNTINKNNLTVFICPTIVMPRVRGGVGEYTKNHVQLAKSYSRESMVFDNLRDPITRWFFKTQHDDAEAEIEDFIAQDEFIAPTLFDVRQETRSVASAGKQTPNKQVVANAPAIHNNNKAANTQQPALQIAQKINEQSQTIAKTDAKYADVKKDENIVIMAQTSEQKESISTKDAPQDLKSLLADAHNPFDKTKGITS